jgi:hypothetical protein
MGKVMNSYERRKDKSPAYWITDFGVLKEVEYYNDPPEGLRPLYWGRARLPTERLRELWEQADNKPGKFARLIEKEHCIHG